MPVLYRSVQQQLPLVVVAGKGPSLFGRNWLMSLGIHKTWVHHMSDRDSLHQLLTKYHDVFKLGLGNIHGVTAKIAVEPTATPVFCCARPVPYSLREKVKEELD